MVELCPLRVNQDGIEPAVDKTNIVRVWTGWLAFDVRVCKFECDQWLAACDVDLNRARERKEHWRAEDELSRVEQVMKQMISENTEVGT